MFKRKNVNFPSLFEKLAALTLIIVFIALCVVASTSDGFAFLFEIWLSALAGEYK